MNMDKMECVVIGGGIVGLAIARRLAIAGREVLLVGRTESQEAPDVPDDKSPGRPDPVEATIMDPLGTLRAAFCARGTAALISYCELHGVPFKRTGQLIAAADEAQLAWLKDLCDQLGGGQA